MIDIQGDRNIMETSIQSERRRCATTHAALTNMKEATFHVSYICYTPSPNRGTTSLFG